MELLYPRCAGLDVHKDIVVACARIHVREYARHLKAEFSTTTSGLLTLADWLEAHQCQQVAMEATGVYRKPVWHVLEGRFELLLVNPGHARNVPGRKSDMNDAHWLADLLAHGLIRASFVPPQPIQELRDLTRTRKQLVRQIARHTLRIQKTLEDANLKLTGVISNLLGTSGRAILKALIAGETDPERLLDHTTGKLKAPRQRLLDGLQGMVTDHHRFMLKLHLRQIDSLETAISQLERQMEKLLRPFRERVEQLVTIPGVSDTVAQVLTAEIGLDMTRFPTSGHLVSWAGLCPRVDESAGKRRSNRCARGLPGSRPRSSWPLGPRPELATPTCAPSSSASRPGGDPRKPSLPLPLPSSPLPTTSCATTFPIRISVPTTSTAAIVPRSFPGSLEGSKPSAIALTFTR